MASAKLHEIGFVCMVKTCTPSEARAERTPKKGADLQRFAPITRKRRQAEPGLNRTLSYEKQSNLNNNSGWQTKVCCLDADYSDSRFANCNTSHRSVSKESGSGPEMRRGLTAPAYNVV